MILTWAEAKHASTSRLCACKIMTTSIRWSKYWDRWAGTAGTISDNSGQRVTWPDPHLQKDQKGARKRYPVLVGAVVVGTVLKGKTGKTLANLDLTSQGQSRWIALKEFVQRECTVCGLKLHQGVQLCKCWTYLMFGLAIVSIVYSSISFGVQGARSY